MPACTYKNGQHQHSRVTTHLNGDVRQVISKFFTKFKIIADIQKVPALDERGEGILVVPWHWPNSTRRPATSLAITTIVGYARTDPLYALPSCICARNETLGFAETRAQIGHHKASQAPGDEEFFYITCHTFDPTQDRRAAENQGCGYHFHLDDYQKAIMEAGSLNNLLATAAAAAPNGVLEFYFPYHEEDHVFIYGSNSAFAGNPPPYPATAPATPSPQHQSGAIGGPSHHRQAIASMKSPRLSLADTPSKSSDLRASDSPSLFHKSPLSSSQHVQSPRAEDPFASPKGKSKAVAVDDPTRSLIYPKSVSTKLTMLLISMDDHEVLSIQEGLLGERGATMMEFNRLFALCPCGLVFARRRLDEHFKTHSRPYVHSLLLAFDHIQPSDWLLDFFALDEKAIIVPQATKAFIASDRASTPSDAVEGLSLAKFQQAFCPCDCGCILERSTLLLHQESAYCEVHYKEPASANPTSSQGNSSAAGSSRS